MSFYRKVRLAVAALSLAGAPELFSQPPSAPSAGRGAFGGQNAPRSPEILPDGRVTFRLLAPRANEVTVTGGWTGAPVAMTKDEQGVWSVTAGPLKPEMYGYAFAVDGTRAIDSRNARTLRDGTRIENILIVPGPQSQLYEVNDVPHGTIAQVWYKSPSLKLTRRMYVYTPPGYEDGTARYPVLYLLHGAGGDEEQWNSDGRATEIMDNLIAQGRARPMIVIMINGNANQAAGPDVGPPAPPPADPQSRAGRGAGAPAGGFSAGIPAISDSIVSDVIPYVEAHYRTLANRENRAIAGLSMGGAQAVYAGLLRLDQFAWVGSFSGAFVLWPGVMTRTEPPPGASPSGPGRGQGLDLATVERIFPDLSAQTNSKLRLFYISCGTDDGLLASNRQFKDWLRTKGVRFMEVETPGYAHVWPYWRISLADMAPRLFRTN